MKKVSLLFMVLCLGFSFEGMSSGEGKDGGAKVVKTKKKRRKKKESSYERGIREAREAEEAKKQAAAPRRGGRKGRKKGTAGASWMAKQKKEKEEKVTSADASAAAADSGPRLKKLSENALDALEEIYSQTASYKSMLATVTKCLTAGGGTAEALSCAREQEGKIVTGIRQIVIDNKDVLLVQSSDFGASNIIGLSVAAVGQLVGRMFWKAADELEKKNKKFDIQQVYVVIQAMNVADVVRSKPKAAKGVVAQVEDTVQVIDGQDAHSFAGVKSLEGLDGLIRASLGDDDYSLTYFGEGQYYSQLVEDEAAFQICLGDGGAFSYQRILSVQLTDDEAGTVKNFRVKDARDLRWQFARRIHAAVEHKNDPAFRFFKSILYDLYILNADVKTPLWSMNEGVLALSAFRELLSQGGNTVFVHWGNIPIHNAAPAVVPAPVAVPAVVAPPVQQLLAVTVQGDDGGEARFRVKNLLDLLKQFRRDLDSDDPHFDISSFDEYVFYISDGGREVDLIQQKDTMTTAEFKRLLRQSNNTAFVRKVRQDVQEVVPAAAAAAPVVNASEQVYLSAPGMDEPESLYVTSFHDLTDQVGRNWSEFDIHGEYKLCYKQLYGVYAEITDARTFDAFMKGRHRNVVIRERGYPIQFSYESEDGRIDIQHEKLYASSYSDLFAQVKQRVPNLGRTGPDGKLVLYTFIYRDMTNFRDINSEATFERFKELGGVHVFVRNDKSAVAAPAAPSGGLRVEVVDRMIMANSPWVGNTKGYYIKYNPGVGSPVDVLKILVDQDMSYVGINSSDYQLTVDGVSLDDLQASRNWDGFQDGDVVYMIPSTAAAAPARQRSAPVVSAGDLDRLLRMLNELTAAM